jgi:hypothetical protein
VVDTREGGKHLRSIVERVYGARRSLESLDARVGVDGDDEDVTERFRLVQVDDMAAVENVETAVREHDAPAESPVLRRHGGENGTVDPLTTPGEAFTQLCGAAVGCSLLRDNHARSGGGDLGGRGRIGAGGEGERQSGREGVTSPDGARIPRRPCVGAISGSIALDDHGTVCVERDGSDAGSAPIEYDVCARRDPNSTSVERRECATADEGDRLLVVRRDGGRADSSITAELLPVGNENARRPRLLACEHIEQSRRDDAERVVGDDHGIDARERLAQMLRKISLSSPADRLRRTAIEAYEELTAGNDPPLRDGSPPAITHDARDSDAGPSELVEQAVTLPIAPNGR